MKIIALLLSALLTAAALAAPDNKSRPTSFVGVPWGSSSSDTLRILATRAGVAVPETIPTGGKIELTGGTFAGQAADRWTLEFADGKLFGATVLLKPADKTAAGLYRELKQMLIGKYGPVSGEKKADSGTSDRRERRLANPTGKTLGTVASWRFTETISDKTRLGIELELAAPAGIVATDETQLILTVRYVNESLKPARGESTGEPKSEPPGKAIKADGL